MSGRKYCRGVAGTLLRPVMADDGSQMRPATQQERKVRASTILKFNSPHCLPEEFGRTLVSGGKQGALLHPRPERTKRVQAKEAWLLEKCIVFCCSDLFGFYCWKQRLQSLGKCIFVTLQNTFLKMWEKQFNHDFGPNHLNFLKEYFFSSSIFLTDVDFIKVRSKSYQDM